MLQRDYLMRMLLSFFQAIVKTLKEDKDQDPMLRAETLEDAISSATEIDGAVLLSLAPESMAGILQVSGTDPRVAGYIANSLKLVSEYMAQAGKDDLSQLRLAQAQSLADAYGFELADSIQDFLEEADPTNAEVDDLS